MGGVKNIWGAIFINIILHFHNFISWETTNTQINEVFLLRISSENVNVSVDTCQYPQIYNFNCRKEFLETLCKCVFIYNFNHNSRAPFGESEKLKKRGGSMVQGQVFLKGEGRVGWRLSYLIFTRFIIFTFRNYFTLCKIVLCILRKKIFFLSP